MARGATLLHAVAAITAWAALALQLILLVGNFADEGRSAAAAIWRFVGFFTILANFLVAIVSSVAVLASDHALASARIRFAALITILLVGITYSLALRHVWSPEGWGAVADHMLHDAVPLLYLLAWLAAPHGALGRRDALWALVPGAAYFAYAVIRGAFDGWYAYYFLDLPALGVTRFLVNAAVILLGVLLISLLFLWIDKLLARRTLLPLQGLH